LTEYSFVFIMVSEQHRGKRNDSRKGNEPEDQNRNFGSISNHHVCIVLALLNFSQSKQNAAQLGGVFLLLIDALVTTE